MKKLIILSLFLFLSSLTFSQTSNNPTCENPIGTWINELKSKLVIESVDTLTGKITGKYISPSGGGANTFPLVGWINNAQADPTKPNNKKVISFTVRWGEIGSITSWTGTCSVSNGIPTIKTLWNLARPNSQFEWDHINTGADNFTPMK